MNGSSIYGDSARTARRSVAFGLAHAFDVMGREARELAQELDADTRHRVRAAGLVSSFSCDLIRGIQVQAEAQVAYGAAALVRQLVEAEYLAWAVSHDPEEADEWLTFSKKIRLQRWQPRKIRQVSGNRIPTTRATVRSAVIQLQRAAWRSSIIDSFGSRCPYTTPVYMVPTPGTTYSALSSTLDLRKDRFKPPGHRCAYRDLAQG